MNEGLFEAGGPIVVLLTLLLYLYRRGALCRVRCCHVCRADVEVGVVRMECPCCLWGAGVPRDTVVVAPQHGHLARRFSEFIARSNARARTPTGSPTGSEDTVDAASSPRILPRR